jgi:hypothetical protein
MKKNTLIVFFAFALLVGGVFLFAGDASAETNVEYQLLEKIPGTIGLKGNDLPGYISAIYKVALVVVTLSAVLMLSIGGFMYLTSAGNTSSISTAKGIIYDSLIGLVIALSAWLILYIINPDLVEITLAPPPSAEITSRPRPEPSGTQTLPPTSSVELAAQILAHPNITLQGAPSADCSSPSGKVSPQKNMQDVAAGKAMAVCSYGCQTKGNSGCTDNETSPSNKMLQAILTVANQGQAFTITSMGGGPHAPSSTHYSGQAIDIAPVTQALLDAFVRAGAITPSAPPTSAACQGAGGLACGQGNAASMCELNGRNVGCAAGSGANHIHLIFSN